MSRALLVDYAKPEIRIELAEDLGRLLSGGLSKPGRLLSGGVYVYLPRSCLSFPHPCNSPPLKVVPCNSPPSK